MYLYEQNITKKNKKPATTLFCFLFFLFFLFFPQGTSLAEAANTVFVSAKQSISSIPDMRTGKEN